MQEVLNGHEKDCCVAFHMEPNIFRKIVSYLKTENLLRDTRGMRVDEQLEMFMFMLSHNASYEDLQFEFKHSGETIHRHINAVFEIIPALTYQFLKPTLTAEPHFKITTDSRFFPYFENCLGAIDGTHVPITIAEAKQALYRNRKGTLSQNIMDEEWLDNQADNIPRGSFVDLLEGDNNYNNDVASLSSQIQNGNAVRDAIALQMWEDYSHNRATVMFGRGSPKINLMQVASMQKKPSPTARTGGKRKKRSPKAKCSKASWNPGLEKGLVQILIDHDNDCYRAQNGWTSDAWNRMVQKFLERFPFVAFSKDQIQDKEKELKRDFRVLKEARKQSGVHWDQKLCMIMAEPEIWDNIIMSHPKASKFQRRVPTIR
ncbi:hypothetical protein QOZ80_9BG0715460 [Eleusine coracana subsp. coracana]|nr:hypothetical protein QOZ80_9BG0715460 [Eleusine coracana subsp. coracana]